MLKEIVISFVIIVAIFAIDFTTQMYANESVEEGTKILNDLKEKIEEEKLMSESEKNKGIDIESSNLSLKEKSDEIKKEAENIFEKWKKRHRKLAFFIEHDELEKVETNLTNLNSYIETQEFAMAITSIDEAKFVLEHIKEKNSFSLENVF